MASFVPDGLRAEVVKQTFIPELAKDITKLGSIEDAIRNIPTTHYLVHGDAREMNSIAPNSVHLIITSPPYWTLKRYDDSNRQLGHIPDYDSFLSELDRVWDRCYEALIPGGRVVCVVGDVCLSRRQNEGRHTVVPLHASIQDRCRKIGFDNLAPIIWHKIANAAYEAGGGGFLGKPYEPNSVIKNDIEYILMFRKPGGYRKPDTAARILSVISSDNYQKWFQQIWTGLTGESTRHHPAPYPTELAERLIRMFSFVGDIVLDPFSGTGTTSIAAARSGRNSIGYEVQQAYFNFAATRLHQETGCLFTAPVIVEEREI
ncbi:MAG TPA: site-specific DNA-methyltransferase [Edaphobacter sp.]|nr:site-specific DNA-methyltransferase [Edaphobacter sp.]